MQTVMRRKTELRVREKEKKNEEWIEKEYSVIKLQCDI